MKKFINWLAYISLTIAFIVGYIISNDNRKNEINQLEFVVKNKLILKEFDSETFSVNKNDSLQGFLAIGEAQGYGGPLSIAVFTDTLGVISQTGLIHNFESASFLAKLYNKKYFDQFGGMSVDNRFLVQEDIDVVSGATVSSTAIAQAVRDASYKIAENNLNIEPPSIDKKFRFGHKEGITLLLFLLGTLFAFWGKKKFKYISLFLGLVFLGFLFNASLSLTHFGRIILGYFPDIHTHFIWWLLIAGTFTVIIIWGKNVYCNTLCPFHAAQIVLNKISGINLKISQKYARLLNKTPGILLWLALIFIFLSSNPTISSYEPFAMLFSLEGAGIQWYILPTTLIGALFFSNFFCRFFCPVGGALRWMLKMRKQVKMLMPDKQLKN